VRWTQRLAVHTDKGFAFAIKVRVTRTKTFVHFFTSIPTLVDKYSMAVIGTNYNLTRKIFLATDFPVH
jgi:hypothetical protein